MVPSVASEKTPATSLGIDPETLRLVAQCLNHHATPGSSKNVGNTKHKTSARGHTANVTKGEVPYFKQPYFEFPLTQNVRHTHPVGIICTSDHLVVDTTTYKSTQPTQERKTDDLSGIWNRNHKSYLRLRPHSHRVWPTHLMLKRNIRFTEKIWLNLSVSIACNTSKKYLNWKLKTLTCINLMDDIYVGLLVIFSIVTSIFVCSKISTL
jgi:hypothetical protein